MPFADFQMLIDDLVRDQSGKISPAERDEALARAVSRYSQDRPSQVAVDVAAPGGNFFDVPAGWQDEFSRIVNIEYPIGSVPPNYIAQDEIGWYRAPAGLKIMLTRSINAGQNVRITYTIARVLDAAADTVPAKHREAVSCWASALLLDQLAAYFSSIKDTTLNVDVADRTSKAQEYAARASRNRARYFDELGIDPKRNTAAGAVVALTDKDSLGQPRLLHPARFR